MSRYHEGELNVQRRAGVAHLAARLEGMPRSDIPSAAREFVAAQTLAVVASADGAGHMWASPLVGPPGFLRVPDERTLLAAARPAAGDPLAANLEDEWPAGLLVIDPARRRRMRVNGRARWNGGGELEVHTEEVYANCPRYIRPREPDAGAPVPAGDSRRSARLNAADRDVIARADTLFIASRHSGRGADASHRGGDAGFVRLAHRGGADALVIPDYAGNNMFNTLGNLQVDPAVGLLIPDFVSGDALQLTGRAELQWDGVARELVVLMEEIVMLRGALGWRWRTL